MVHATILLVPLLSLAGAQVVHHSPVVHHGQGSSFQTRTYFGPSAGQVQHLNAAPKVYAAQPLAYAQPLSYNQLAAYAQPSQQPIKYAAAPSYARKPVAYTAAAPTPYVPKTVASAAAAPAPYVPKTVAYAAAAPSPYVPQVAAYQPLATTYSTDSAYTYDPKNPSKPFDYKYQYNPNSEFNLNVNAEELIDSAIYQTQEQGAKVVKTLRTLMDNKLIATVFGSNGSNDPCAIIPEDLDATVQGLIDGISSARPQLVGLIASLQEMKRNEKDTSKVIKTAARAVKDVEPLLPIFSNLFKTNPGCEASIDATVKKFDGVGNVLETLGRTNLVSSDGYTKNRLIQGGQASKIISRVALDFENNQFLNLCSDSPTFTKDVFSGVGGLLGGLKDIVLTFNDGQNSADLQKLDETVALINDGADLLEDLDFQPLVAAAAPGAKNCKTTIPDVARSLSEVADLVDLIDPKSFN